MKGKSMTNTFWARYLRLPKIRFQETKKYEDGVGNRKIYEWEVDKRKSSSENRRS